MPDQAAGLRALFRPRQPQWVPVLDSPQCEGAEVVLDALVGAYLERGLNVLVVDAGARARTVSELALLNLAACIEPLSAKVSWLEARGLISHHLDHRGSAARLLPLLAAAAPQADVILLRAGVAEMARVLAPPQAQQTRPVLVTDLQQHNLTAAYSAMKWLRERTSTVVFGLVVAGHPDLALTQRIARQLADCAERFLGAALPNWAALEPGRPKPSPALRRLARDCLQPDAGLELEAGNLPHQEGFSRSEFVAAAR
jgi:flagellar biosynthesis protein FlhG